MLKIQHAILHAFDFESGSIHVSERELDASSKQIRSYLQRSMRKVLNSVDLQTATVGEESNFENAMKQYQAGNIHFIDLSQQLATFLWEELRRADDMEECDVLICTFLNSEQMKAGKDESEVPESEDLDHEYFAVLLLPRKEAFAHQLGADASGMSLNDIIKMGSTLPNPAAKLDNYLLFDFNTKHLGVCDKPKSVAAQDRKILIEGLLQASTKKSTKELVKKVEELVEEVAAEADLPAAEVVAHAKALLSADADREEKFSPEEVSRVVFEEKPELHEKFVERSRAEEIPEKVEVKRSVAKRLAKNHKIKTDTGIEISFPSEYAADSNYIEFNRTSDGSVEITIKNVQHIENK